MLLGAFDEVADRPHENGVLTMETPNDIDMWAILQPLFTETHVASSGQSHAAFYGYDRNPSSSAATMQRKIQEKMVTAAVMGQSALPAFTDDPEDFLTWRNDVFRSFTVAGLQAVLTPHFTTRALGDQLL